MGFSIPKRTIYNVPAAGNNPVQIPVTVNGTYYVEITECPPVGETFNGANFAPQGMNFMLPEDGFAAANAKGVVAGDVLTFGNKDTMARQLGGRGLGFAQRPDVSQPGKNVPATILCELVSATAVATQVQVSEWV